MSADVAVDLGTSTSRVVVRGRGLVLEAPSVVALRGGELAAVGADAREMLGRSPSGVRVVQPIRGGVVADFDATETLLHYLLREAAPRSLRRPRVLVCVPAETTEVERRAVQDAARAAGARDVTLVAAPLAAALGAGLPIVDPIGSLILDIGAGQTEVAVISLGGMVVHRALRVAGNALDEAVAHWLRSRRNVVIGEQTAEGLKLKHGHAAPPEHPDTFRIRGRDLATGKPRDLDLGEDELATAMAEPIARIRDTLLEALASTPPELCADLLDRGVLVCGGTSNLRGLSRVLRDATGMPVLQAEAPTHCTALGAARLLDDAALYERVVTAA